jgi:nitrous oxidase accessory protein NosD
LLQYWAGYEATYNFSIENNTFKGNHIGFNAYTPEQLADQQCYGFHLFSNTFEDNRIGASFERVHDCSVTDNRFLNNIQAGLRLVNQPDVALNSNYFEGNLQDTLR